MALFDRGALAHVDLHAPAAPPISSASACAAARSRSATATRTPARCQGAHDRRANPPRAAGDEGAAAGEVEDASHIADFLSILVRVQIFTDLVVNLKHYRTLDLCDNVRI